MTRTKALSDTLTELRDAALPHLPESARAAFTGALKKARAEILGLGLAKAQADERTDEEVQLLAAAKRFARAGRRASKDKSVSTFAELNDLCMAASRYLDAEKLPCHAKSSAEDGDGRP